MQRRYLNYYERELRFLRESVGEFAEEFPKIAGRLGVSGTDCSDPYVERLIEGFALLAARVQLKIDDELPEFSRHLLQLVYPHYPAPLPSMAVVQMTPDPSEGDLAAGVEVPRGTRLRSVKLKGERTACDYRTAHAVTLWPIEISEAEYFTHTGPVLRTELPLLARAGGGLRLRLRTTGAARLNQIGLDRLVLFLRGSDQHPFRLHEYLAADTIGVVAQPVERPLPWCRVLDATRVRPLGFADDQALIPFPPAAFEGYRYLLEYFAFPERFLFIEIAGLAPVLAAAAATEIDLIVLAGRPDLQLANVVEASNFALFCTPAINLFSRRCDRVRLDDAVHEHHVVPDRTRPLDFEIYQITDVVARGKKADEECHFRPLYAFRDPAAESARHPYFSLIRRPRLRSQREQLHGGRSSYIGTEVYLDLVDPNGPDPVRTDLSQLDVTALCTNRDLPLQLPVGLGETDFTIDVASPVTAVRVVAGPTRPIPAGAEGDITWRLISHLSLNYLSLADSSPEQGAEALRALLSLYADLTDPQLRAQVEGVRSIAVAPITRRLPGPGPVTYARGLAITLTFHELSFPGVGPYLLGSVLERFFARYVSINAFTELHLKTNQREVHRWPPTIGRRQSL